MIRAASSSQSRLWFLDKMEAGNSGYHEILHLEVLGIPNLCALSAALSSVLAGQDALKEGFRWGEGGVECHRDEALETSIAIADFPVPDHVATESCLEAIEESLAVIPLDLSKPPLFRIVYWRLGGHRGLLSVKIHHIICDGWSMRIFLRQLFSGYAAARTGTLQGPPAAGLPTASVPASRVESPLPDPMAYWKRRLGAVGFRLALPLDFPRTHRTNSKGEKLNLELGSERSGSLRLLAGRLGCTPFTLFLSLYGILLHRLTHQNRILVGVPFANRDLSGTDTRIGFFANTLVALVELDGNPTLPELITRVGKSCAEAFDHNVPFEALVNALNPERDPDWPPVFQAMFVHQQIDPQVYHGEDCRVQVLNSRSAHPKCDLEANLLESDGGFLLSLQYNPALFRRNTAMRILGFFGNLCQEALREHDRPIGAMDMLSTAERHILRREWNDTDLANPASTGLTEGLGNSADLRPDAVAAEADGASITFSVLDHRSSLAAGWMKKSGIEVGESVGILMPRGIPRLLAMLGLLKAGGVYVPLDRNAPQSRVKHILEIGGVRRVLVGQEFRKGDLPEGCELMDFGRFLDLMDEGGDPGITSFGAGHGILPHQAAYVMFTSGSTGSPKGIVISHGNAQGFIQAMADRVSIGPGDIFAVITGPGFDISIMEMFLPLATGGRMLLVPEEAERDPILLARIIDRARINAVQAGPSRWQMLLRTGWTGRPDLKLFSGAEPLTRTLADELLKRSMTLWNLYGPTEATVWATAEKVARTGLITLGRPIGRRRAYVLDPYLDLCPIGVPGEIHLGGEGLASAVLTANRSPKADRFLPDPHAERPGSLMYRTGDLGYVTTAGTIHYLGRKDNQVKVRGFRIEIEEIEKSMEASGGIERGIVMTTGNGTDKELLGLFKMQNGAEMSETALRAWLAERLPAYMVPARLIEVGDFPLNSNGKIDRKRLAIEYASPHLDRIETPVSMGAGDSFDARVRSVFEAALKRRQVDAAANFFDLGGNSLGLAELQMLIAQEFGLEIRVVDLFRFASLAGLSAFLRGKVEPRNQGASADQLAREPAIVADRGIGLRKAFMAQRGKLNKS